MTEARTGGFAVLVLDMARTGEPDGERLVDGFPTLAAARAYAEARTRASVEELRSAGQSAAALHTLWHLYGEGCLVVGGRFSGRDWLAAYIAEPPSPGQCDWSALAPGEPNGSAE